MRNTQGTETVGDLSNEATRKMLKIVDIAAGRILKKIELEPHASGLGYQIDAAEIARLTGFARIVSALEEARANAKKSDDELDTRVEKKLRALLAEEAE